ncbi:tRNA (uridine(54)-C5)-methyltransferase TrmA, partial [Pseudomonas syringae pv. tagetis]
CYHRPHDADWQAAAEQLAAELEDSLIGRSKGQKLVIGQDYVIEKLDVAGRTFRYRQPEGAFSQPNGNLNGKMLNWPFD